ncbi:MAG TPA: cation diffusion facilitator family transporter [Thermomicrobiales bacterium]|nr:cation diffusion facilitator family transporter [Thermomicrobiales bacterium]
MSNHPTISGEHHHGNAEGSPEHANRRPLAIALLITGLFLVVEIIGGLITGSLALLADAGHMATDVAALALSLFAIWLAQRPATPERSYGFARAEVLAALLNAATLVAISIYIFWEAFSRIGSPPEVDSGPMLVVAAAGLGANAVSAWVLMRGGGHKHNLNTRGAFLHVVGDMLGSVGAIVAALVMLATGWYLADPILSAGIGLLILWSSWQLLRESVEVLLEATPKGIDAMEVRAAMAQVEGVSGVHDLHIWTVTSGLIALSAHVEIAAGRDWHQLLDQCTLPLREHFGIAHVTLQPEILDGSTRRFDGCSLDTEEGRNACRMALPARSLNPRHGQPHQH